MQQKTQVYISNLKEDCKRNDSTVGYCSPQALELIEQNVPVDFWEDCHKESMFKDSSPWAF